MLPKSSDVRRSLFILLASLAAASAWGQSQTRTLSIKYGDTEQRLTFNPNLISEDDLRRLAQLSPNTSEHALNLSPTLELCVSGRPDYLECGSRDLHAKNFFHNAEINLKKSNATLEDLGALQHPRELDPIVEYLSRSLTFALWREQARLDFYRSWNVDVLRHDYQDIKPNGACSTVIQAISVASTEDEKYRLARQWSTCVLRARTQPYPEAAWRRFLKAYEITEVIEEEMD